MLAGAIYAGAVEDYITPSSRQGSDCSERSCNTRMAHHQQKVDRVPVVLPMKNGHAGVIFQQMRHARSIRQLVDCTTVISARRPDSYKARTTLRPCDRSHLSLRVRS